MAQPPVDLKSKLLDVPIPKENKDFSDQKKAAKEHRKNKDKARTGSIFESFVKKDGVEEYIERRRFGGNLAESDSSDGDDNIS